MNAPATATVVLPTRDRCGVLARTLEALAAQRGAGEGLDLVVVDDGSVDGTPAVLRDLLPRLPFPARALRGEGRGPAAARNRALAEARGGLLLFLGDDMIPAPGWLEAHRAAQVRLPGRAVVGEIRWHPDLGEDPFLAFLAPRGPQFDYGEMRDPGDLGYARLFASNLSLARASLGEERFDERFPFALEERELGWRLARRGVKVAYEPGALVHHLHRVTLRSYERRMEGTGRSARILERVQPLLGPEVRPRLPALQRVAGALLARVPDGALPARLRRLRWRAVLGAAFCRGYAAGADGG